MSHTRVQGVVVFFPTPYNPVSDSPWRKSGSEESSSSFDARLMIAASRPSMIVLVSGRNCRLRKLRIQQGPLKVGDFFEAF